MKKALMGLSGLALAAMALTGCAGDKKEEEDVVVEPDGVEQVDETEKEGDKTVEVDETEDDGVVEDVEEEETVDEK